MSVTIARRQHIHLPWKTIAIVLGAAAVAAAVLVLVNQPGQEQTVGSSATTATNARHAVAVSNARTRPLLRSTWEARREAAAASIASAAALETRPAAALLHNRVEGVTLDGGRKRVVQQSAPWYPPGAVDNARPLNFTAGGSR